ncbi:MAG TPA: hypothetical protein VFQ27_02865 [Xanthobacteraceae bacterium]|nr:hypothetical protein [Xanthobacteraceae bacterium]
MAVTELETSVVMMPERKPAPAIVLYGGLYHLEGAWFVKQIPAALTACVAFVLPKHYTNKCTTCLDELHSQIAADDISSYSLCGYSRGGVEVYRYRDLKDWKIFGLIDPTAPSMGGFKDTVLDAKKDRIRCVYWVPNWGKDGYGGRIPAFAQHLRDLKVDMKEEAVGHKHMPTYFFKTYGKEWTG